MTVFTNQTKVPLSVAVYLATDFYDHVPDTVSATGLMRPVRQRILAPRVPVEKQPTDILNVVKSRIGTSIHDGVEKVWVGGHYKHSMRKLGYPDEVIRRVVVNPGYTHDEAGNLVKMENAPPLPKDAIPVYLEIRSFRSLDGTTVSGKFDFLANGGLEDFKSTSTYTWIKDTKTDDYKIQGSIYRWLNPELITKDFIAIRFFFMDFMQSKAGDPKYPNRQVESLQIPLMSLEDTEDYIRGRIALYDQYKDQPEEALPLCTDKELWRKDTVWKYYKNPAKTTRSTKNYDSSAEAYTRLTEDGNVGIVKEVLGECVACKYCAAFEACKQKDHLIATGALVM